MTFNTFLMLKSRLKIHVFNTRPQNPNQDISAADRVPEDA